MTCITKDQIRSEISASGTHLSSSPDGVDNGYGFESLVVLRPNRANSRASPVVWRNRVLQKSTPDPRAKFMARRCCPVVSDAAVKDCSVQRGRPTNKSSRMLKRFSLVSSKGVISSTLPAERLICINCCLCSAAVVWAPTSTASAISLTTCSLAAMAALGIMLVANHCIKCFQLVHTGS